MTAPNFSSEPNDSGLLLRRFHLEDEIVFDRQVLVESTSASDGATMIHPLVHALGDALTTADAALAELDPTLLGTALVRSSRDLAQAVGHLADQLEQSSVEDRQILAQACLDDMMRMTRSSMPQQQQQQQQQEWTTDDMVVALAGASSLLRDIQAGLQSMEQEEADEIATVALTLARLFLASFQSVYSTMLLPRLQQPDQEHSSQFELLEQDHQHDTTTTTNNNNNNNNNHTTNERQEQYRQKQQQQQQQRIDRLRILWPPLGPAVVQACQWGKDQALQRPILAVALGMTLWPAAVVTALIGTPLVVADAVVQHAYQSVVQQQNSPLLLLVVQSVETTAFSLQQAATLTWMCTKLVTRQSWRVAHLQIQRQGGIGPMAQSWAGMAVERVLHPVETVTAVWQGLHWTLGAVAEQWNTWHHHHHHHHHHRGDDAQDYDATPADAWRQ
jgi:hypothetical protein